MQLPIKHVATLYALRNFGLNSKGF